MDRRSFLKRTAVVVGSSAVTRALHADKLTFADRTDEWEAFRKQHFDLDWNLVQMAGFFIASHPRPVKEAIERHRRELDRNPFDYIEQNIGNFERATRSSAAEYLGATTDDLAMTDSTTMGLGIVYCGLLLKVGQEILSTKHDHRATNTALDFASERTGVPVRRVALYDDPAQASEDEIVARISRELTHRTRIVAVTWVHSSTGVKLPIGKIADALAEHNRNREEQEQALLCVDGVHGFGVEDSEISDLRCDFFMAGCHKWIFGPRGTGLIWGSKRGWAAARPTIPSFDGMWRGRDRTTWPAVAHMTPGGFHSFEHRWALPEAFRLHQQLGKPRVAARIHELNTQCKEELAKMQRVKLYTPKSDRLSAGIICFDIDGMKQTEVVARLHARNIIASTTPYAVSYARLSPSLLTLPEDVETTLREVRALAA
jgi:selenocysteine lyase/cysteine desulfurase